ncbi:Hypothetical protein SRAE_1000023800 [Strongyloides ratti]|uniref:Uncharacterized protein n=1 Tax=Strongyloides ratti TaxID=34506 RepID=A0A090L1G7_STRRB|nr:Hypothetical protein SRAE_1000023800 [Strongyloides ratti]CEF61962.1 Hypothetical protein SRAE_1000023800 [Strongyloides ratti]
MNQSNNSTEEVGSSKASESLIALTTTGPKNSTSRKRLSDEVKKSSTNKKIRKMNSSSIDNYNLEEPGPINKLQINEENCGRNSETSICHDIPDKMLTRAQTKLLEAQKSISRQNDNCFSNNQHVSLKKLLEKEDDTPNYSNTELGRILSSDNTHTGKSSVTKNKVGLSMYLSLILYNSPTKTLVICLLL